ncbi:hypothetical protein ACROYT_G012242 [Oculina patagonica]
MNSKGFNPYSGEITARNYFTAGVARRSSYGTARTSQVHNYNGARHGLFPWTQSARCFSVSARSSADNTELLQDEKVTNPFLQESMPESALDPVTTNSEMLKDMADSLTALGEPSLSSLGLGGWSPIGIVQQCLELVHVYGDISWCASVALVTVCFRLLCLPLVVKAQANTAKLNNIKPQIEEIQAKMRELMNSQDSVAQATATAKMKQLYQDHDCHPFKSILGPLVQMPLFISFFFAIRRMAYLPVESFKTGGYLWFQDLTLYDPYFVLPIICSFSMLASIELGADAGISNPTMKSMKTVMRIMAVAMIPLTAQFPAAIFSYWVTSNMFTIGQVAFLRQPTVRKWMGIPDMKTFENLPPTAGFLENMKAGYKSSQEATYIRHAENMKRQRMKALGEAPLEPTYEFNPRIEQNQEVFSLPDNSERSNKRRNRRRKEQTPQGRNEPKVKYNQEFFSAKTHQKAKSEKLKMRLGLPCEYIK